MSKADNMLAILWLLRSGRRMTGQQIADELEIHVRTVYRLIDALCASGVPIIADAGHRGGYRILETFKEAPLFFDPAEQKALIHAAAFARGAGYPYDSALEEAVRKLKRYADASQRERLERHEAGFDVVYPKADERQQRIVALLEEAAAEQRSSEIVYASRSGETARRLDPYGIVFWKGSWYVVGYCHLRREIRSFRADRVASAAVTETSFERPAGFSAKDWLMRGLLPDTADGSGTVEISVRGAGGALDELCKHWLFGHALCARTAETARFRLDSGAMHKYVPYYLLPYGRAIIVEAPESLVVRMAEVTAGMADHYRIRNERKHMDRTDGAAEREEAEEA